MIFDSHSKPVSTQAASAIAKIGVALKSRAWAGGEEQDLTPTQGQIVSLLADAGAKGLAPSEIAQQLQVSRPTVSDAIAALTRKELAERLVQANDKRAARIRLTAKGRRRAAKVGDWPDFLVQAIDHLPSGQQEALYRGLVGTIRSLQVAGEIPVQRMCVTCRHFRPNVHADPAAPHHCAFVDAAFGDRHLRLDCSDQEDAAAPDQQDAWQRFIATDK